MRFTMLDNELPNRGCDLNHNEDPDVLKRARQYNDGGTLKRRCPYCGAYLKGGKCPVGKTDCGRP